jgi:hypothetical protein
MRYDVLARAELPPVRRRLLLAWEKGVPAPPATASSHACSFVEPAVCVCPGEVLPLGIAGVDLRHLLSAIGQSAAMAPVSRRLLKSRRGSRVTRSGTRINAIVHNLEPEDLELTGESVARALPLARTDRIPGLSPVT